MARYQLLLSYRLIVPIATSLTWKEQVVSFHHLLAIQELASGLARGVQ
jgi:hypothetical protein